LIYWYPLTQTERESIKNGAIITKHFDMDSIPHNRMLMVFVGKTKVPEERCKGMLKAGISATSIVLTDADLSKIEDGDGVSARYSDFEVCVVAQEILDKLAKAKEAS
jgi:hypothetical protein